MCTGDQHALIMKVIKMYLIKRDLQRYNDIGMYVTT